MEINKIPGVDQETANLYFEMQDAAGWESSASQAIEEAAELIQALSKLKRVHSYGCATPKKHEEVWENLIEEWADLNAMMKLVMRKFGTEDDHRLAEEITAQKTRRYIERNHDRFIDGSIK